MKNYFVSGPKSMKNGSAVRVYVNQPASLFSFPESEGYHYCEPCNRWVFNNNKHCEKCKGCMSKVSSLAIVSKKAIFFIKYNV